MVHVIRLTYMFTVWSNFSYKMVLHSERIILLSMFYRAYANDYYFCYSLKVLLLCLD